MKSYPEGTLTVLRLGTRGSARWPLPRAFWYAKADLEATGSVTVRSRSHPVPPVTAISRVLSLLGLEGKGLFTRELDMALLDDRIDFAVHSLKDLPTDPEAWARCWRPFRSVRIPVTCMIGPESSRHESRDASRPSRRGARVGTSSLRRQGPRFARFDPTVEVDEHPGQPGHAHRQGGPRRVGRDRSGRCRRSADWVYGHRVGEALERTAWLARTRAGRTRSPHPIADDAKDGNARSKRFGPSAVSRVAVRCRTRALLAALGGGCQTPHRRARPAVRPRAADCGLSWRVLDGNSGGARPMVTGRLDRSRGTGEEARWSGSLAEGGASELLQEESPMPQLPAPTRESQSLNRAFPMSVHRQDPLPRDELLQRLRPSAGRTRVAIHQRLFRPSPPRSCGVPRQRSAAGRRPRGRHQHGPLHACAQGAG